MLARNVTVAMVAAVFLVGAPAIAQTAGTPDKPAVSPSPWSFSFAPYGWLTFMSGTQTVKGQAAAVNSNAFEMYAASQTLISLMAYSEVRYEDRIGLFTDLVYANLTAGKTATKSFAVSGISGSTVASMSANYESVILQFGGTYEVAKVGPDRGAEGPGMAGVGQTAFDLLLGGRWWYQAIDLTLNFRSAVTVSAPNLSLSGNRSRVRANSGSIGWVDPVVGFRVRHRLAPGQNFTLEADVGGFGIGSRISAQAQFAYAREFGNAMGVNWAGVAGYRALYVDYRQGSGSSLFEMDMVQHGPLLGVRGRF